jgi:hypothetical protein
LPHFWATTYFLSSPTSLVSSLNGIEGLVVDDLYSDLEVVRCGRIRCKLMRQTNVQVMNGIVMILEDKGVVLGV